ncbi:hypothetical protein [Nitrospira sp. M1]
MTSRFIFLILVAGFVLTGCVSTKDQASYITEQIEGQRVIAMVGKRYPWVNPIMQRLKNEGFSIKRFASVSETTEKVSATKMETYNKATARVILNIDSFAANTSWTRCFGGGYKFSYIYAELIDARNNETMATYSNSGYSENCPPMSGTIFQDITDMVTSAFK